MAEAGEKGPWIVEPPVFRSAHSASLVLLSCWEPVLLSRSNSESWPSRVRCRGIVATRAIHGGTRRKGTAKLGQEQIDLYRADISREHSARAGRRSGRPVRLTTEGCDHKTPTTLHLITKPAGGARTRPWRPPAEPRVRHSRTDNASVMMPPVLAALPQQYSHSLVKGYVRNPWKDSRSPSESPPCDRV